MTAYHIAQLNIAKVRDSMDSATMKGFVDRLDEINSLADNSPGFVWRLQTDEGDATSIEAFTSKALIKDTVNSRPSEAATARDGGS